MDITFVFPSGGDLNLSKFSYNLGSAYVIAYLRKHGFKTEQFISNESFNVKECVKKITKNAPKMVGFTVYESNFMQCVLISNGLKKFNPNLITIFGGPTPTIQSKEILEIVKSVDLCVRGEGEEVLLDLISVLSNNDFNLSKANLNDIKGITFKKGNSIIKNPRSYVLLSNRSVKYYLDKYPSPFLTQVIPVSEAFPIGIITARGCNQNCIYCNCAVLNNRNIFFHSISRVIEELRHISECGIFNGPIPINDDSFTIIPSRAKRICEEIIKQGIKIPLSCITRCDKIDQDLLDLMKQAGFVSLGFSLESAVPRILRSIGKVNNPESLILKDFDKEVEYIQKLKNMVIYAKKIGMYPVFVSIMVGLPGESIQDAKKTINLVKQLNVDFYTHNHLHIFKGTPLYNNYKKLGYHVEPIGQKNKIMLRNDFPFDVYKIKVAPKSAIEQNSKVIDYANLKILSLKTNRITQKPFFNNLIINCDLIKQSLIEWIQENLAINGRIIHIYSNRRKYKNLYQENMRSLFNEFSPTTDYKCYYWEKKIIHVL
ncbi:MAG: B12-binding domain-containing radical SAM protein [Promethearchaeota archaeon]